MSRLTFLRHLFLTLTLTSLLAAPARALDLSWSNASREQKLWTVNLGTMAFITAWGVYKWDYFERSPHTGSEGWFGKDTKEGGADKVGHLWSTYAVSDGLASLYHDWGYNEEEAARYGALSSFAIMGFMEVGDSFSRYGFSYEDMVMNTIGAASSYILYKYPALDDKIDLRWEYAPEFNNGDIFTDYENTKYLMALQLDGFPELEATPLKYLELHMGYYARGFEDARPDRERNFYVGVGLNVGRILGKLGCGNRCETFFHYYQPPYTYLPTK